MLLQLPRVCHYRREGGREERGREPLGRGQSLVKVLVVRHDYGHHPLESVRVLARLLGALVERGRDHLLVATRPHRRRYESVAVLPRDTRDLGAMARYDHGYGGFRL